MYRGFYGYGQGLGFSAFPWIHLGLGLVFIALVVTAIVLVSRNARRLGGGLNSGAIDFSRALETLAERFARGEIDAETFRAMKSELEQPK